MGAPSDERGTFLFSRTNGGSAEEKPEEENIHNQMSEINLIEWVCGRERRSE